ncbi:hypothetical protein Tco_0567916 [Tanacetum coccineum]
MADFVLGRAVIDVAQYKWVKYEAKCANIGFGFLPFSFSSLGEFEEDALTLLKRIRKFSIAQDIGARVAIHIFNRIGFAIAKGFSRRQRFFLYDITKPYVPSSSEQLEHVDNLGQDQHGSFTLALLDSLLSKGLHTVKSIPPKCRSRFSRVLKGAHDYVIYTPDDIFCWWKHQEESIVNVIRSWSVPRGSLQLVRENLAKSSPPLLHVDEEDLDLGERNIKQCKRKICDGHYTAVVRVLSSSGVSPYNHATLDDLKTKHPFKPAPSLLDLPIDSHHLIASPTIVLDRLKSFPRGTSYGRDGLREYIANAPLTLLVKSGGGIRPIVVGTVWRRLVSKVSAVMISHSLDDYLDDLQFGVGVSGGSEAILHAVNRLIEEHGNSITPTQLDCIIGSTPYGHAKGCNRAWYLDDGTIAGDTLVVGNVLELIMEDGPSCGLHLNVGKTKVFWLKEDPKSRLAGIFPPNISWPLHGVKLLFGPVSVDIDFSSELVMKRVSKTIKLMDAVAKNNDPQSQRSFDAALRSSLECIVTASGPGFGDSQWRLATLPFAFGGIGVYSAACKEVDIGLDGGRDKPLRPADMLLYSWDGGLDVCVDLTWSSPLTQTEMADFVPGRAMIDAPHRKRVKYETKCAAIGYGFLPFSFYSLGELEEGAIILLKRIQKFSMT